jgi:hypothetical protein
MTIQTIAIIKNGETPSSYRTNPGQLTGPWGSSVNEAISTYQEVTGWTVIHHWMIGNDLWITTNEES